MFSTFQH